LNLDRESEFSVPPLSVPDESEEFEGLQHCESVKLFVDRARAARALFELQRSNALAVAKLCRELEGIPLAIELAAARAPVLTPEQMLGRLSSHRLDLLATPRRNASSRHRYSPDLQAH
jgi:predicted ATPase